MTHEDKSGPDQLQRERDELLRRTAELESAERETRQALAFLLKSERKYRLLIENMPDIIAWFDRDLRHRYVNPAMERATGLRPGECIGKTNEDLGLPMRQVEFWNEHLRGVFRTGQPRSIEFSFPAPGGIRYFHSRLEPVLDDAGEVESVISVARDITGIRRMESILQESRDSLAEAQEVAKLGSSSYDFRTGKLVWSDSLYHILDLPPDTEPGLDLYRSLLHPGDIEWLDGLQQSARQTDGDFRYEVEYRIVTQKGETRHLSGISRIHRDGNGVPLKVTSVIQDISERKRNGSA